LFPFLDDTPMAGAEESTLCPTPIGTVGVQVVPTLSLSEGLLPLLQDKKSLSSLLKPLTSVETKDHFRSYQSDQWSERYEELLGYKKEYGHCNVPYQWSGNNPLSQWVKRQRHQFKLKQENRHSNLSDDRQAMLDKLGFVWDSRQAAWEERFEELKMFHRQHGHCKVTKKFVNYSQLALWLKRQRHQCRLFLVGDRNSGMSTDRVAKLLDLGLNLNCR
jgi:hypothetical protein